MTDRVMITVICKKQKWDMEIPANIPLERIEPGLILALRSKGIFLNGPLEYIGNGQPLDPAATLLRAGVWDGSYLEVRDRS